MVKYTYRELDSEAEGILSNDPFEYPTTPWTPPPSCTAVYVCSSVWPASQNYNTQKWRFCQQPRYSISHNLYICDLRSGQIPVLYITSLWENTVMGPALSKWVKTTQFFQDYHGLSYLWWSRCRLLTGTSEKVIWGHVRSSVVHCQ